ncbi:ABC transporter substrate-binding protein [Paenirhodobacter sp.]|uniref:ABC transporter substrate-binding protein n=1 Tax=Paenirhodobacter sp. TaxID=1965326 RepID=UPI003B41B132
MTRSVLTAILLACLTLPVQAEPARVVSINLCTDQLAMLLAAPGQLVSVSHIARDPLSSAMAAEAARHPVNHGLAEEVFALRPDLVLAGEYTHRETVALLRRMGVRVETFAAAQDMEGVAAGIRAMGRALGRAAEGEALATRFGADLARLRRDPAGGPRAALYYANGYSLGDATLSGQILAAAGYRNIAGEAGLSAGGTLPLEVLVMAHPDLIVQGERHATPSRSEEILTHPALAASPARRVEMADRDWICGTPFVLRALAALRAP